MIRTAFVIIGLFSLMIGYSQVGIGNPLSLAPFHIDGKENNPIGVNPSLEEAIDDFVIDKEGNVGIGIYEPKAKLDVNGKMKVIDGNQGESRVMMSDDQGNLNWQSIPYIVPTVLGEFKSTSPVSNSSTTSGYIFSNGQITLTKGRWIVNAGLTLVLQANQNLWLQAILSSSKTDKRQVGFTFPGNAGNNTAYASRMNISESNYSLLSGSSVIDVTAPVVTVYLLILREGKWSFAPTSWENYFYAIPVL